MYIAVVIRKTLKAFYSEVSLWIVFLQRFTLLVGWREGHAACKIH